MRKLLAFVMALMCVAGFAQNKISVGLDFGVFFPSDETTRTVFRDAWWRIGLTPLSFQKPDKWSFAFDLGILRQSRNGNSVTLVPVTFGVTRSFGADPSSRPYVALRAGPYWGDVNSPTLGVDTSKFGFDANVAVGVTFNQQFYIEGRYDYFSPFEGIKFSGFQVSFGVKLFDIKL